MLTTYLITTPPMFLLYGNLMTDLTSIINIVANKHYGQKFSVKNYKLL